MASFLVAPPGPTAVLMSDTLANQDMTLDVPPWSCALTALSLPAQAQQRRSWARLRPGLLVTSD